MYFTPLGSKPVGRMSFTCQVSRCHEILQPPCTPSLRFCCCQARACKTSPRAQIYSFTLRLRYKSPGWTPRIDAPAHYSSALFTFTTFMIIGQLQIKPRGSARPQNSCPIASHRARRPQRIQREVHGASPARLGAPLGLWLPSLRLHGAWLAIVLVP